MLILKDNRLLKTKIVATIGEKRGGLKTDNEGKQYVDLIHNSQDRVVREEVTYGQLLEWLIREGADVIRLNMSFAHLGGKKYGEDAKEVLDWIKANRDGLAKWIVVLGDLPGPKIRLGIEKEITLKEGDDFFLDFEKRGRWSNLGNKADVLLDDKAFFNSDSEVSVDGETNIHDYIRTKNEKNEKVIFFVGDGEVQLEAKVDSPEKGIVECKVLRGDTVRGKPGFTIKKADIEAKPASNSDSYPFLGADKEALDFLVKEGQGVVSYIGVSFVNTPDDVINVKRYVENHFYQKYKAEYPFQEYLKKREDQGKSISLEDAWKEYHKLLKQKARRYAPHVIAKFETRKACTEAQPPRKRDCIDQILDVADGAMVARGDLGLQHDPQEVPAIQKRIIRKCNLRGKPVITATQMLDSMEHSIEPTRAEANDVFNAIQDGTDAVMLSGETSTGAYPPQAVRMMAQIANEAEVYYRKRFSGKAYERRLQNFMDDADDSSRETSMWLAELMTSALRDAAKADQRKNISPEEVSKKEWKSQWYTEKSKRIAKQKITDRISESACLLSAAGEDNGEGNGEKNGNDDLGIERYKAIIAPTTSGRTARMIARFRPNVPIIGVAHDEANARKMILSFGVYPLWIGDTQQTVEAVFDDASREVIKKGYTPLNAEFQLLREGDVVISTSGTPLLEVGTTNLIQIKEVRVKESREQPEISGGLAAGADL